MLRQRITRPRERQRPPLIGVEPRHLGLEPGSACAPCIDGDGVRGDRATAYEERAPTAGSVAARPRGRRAEPALSAGALAYGDTEPALSAGTLADGDVEPTL